MNASSMHHQSLLLLYFIIIISLFCLKMNRVIGFTARATRRRRAKTAMTRSSRRHYSTLATVHTEWKQSQRHNSFLLASVNNDELSEESQQDLVERLEQKIAQCNFDQPLNVNSPKQVSMAIFGTVQSTSKLELSKASQGEGVEYQRQQELAKLVLELRSLTSKVKQKSKVNGDARFIEEEQVDTNGKVADMVNKLTTNDEDNGKASETIATTATQQTSTSSHEQNVDSLFDAKSSKLDPYWKEALTQVTKPSAQNLVFQLNAQLCPTGFDPSASPHVRSTSTSTSEVRKKGTLLHFIRQQKLKYRDCIILTRVGEFYETYGMDAVLLVEHCGLNAMGGKAKAGCPVRNVQATLDCLTSRGFRVAVYEEVADTDSSSGPGQKGRIKNRMLTQIVSPASPTYLYDLVLKENVDALVSSPASRPYVGILHSAAGYTLVQVNTEEQTVRISERLTAEAVACNLAAYPPADPLIYIPSSTKSGTTALPFLPSKSDAASDGPGSRLHLKVLPASLVEEPAAGVSDIERARRTIVGVLLKMTEQKEDEHVAKLDDFVLVASSSTGDDAINTGTQVNPLYVETATQLGLMNDKTIPPLVSYLLPDSSPAATRRFLRRWLLTPPPPNVAESMSTVVKFLKDSGTALPPLTVPPIGKVLALLRAGQASAQVFSELLSAMDATIAFLDTLQNDGHENVISPLMILLEYESGIAANAVSLRARCVEAIGVIEAVISPMHHVGNTFDDDDDDISDFGNLIPRAFFERNEARWRGRVQSAAAEESYATVQKAADDLAKAVAVDFWGLDESASMQDFLKETDQLKSPIVQDLFDNIFSLKKIPSWLDASVDELPPTYFHPRDRNGKQMRNRYTSTNVQTALSEYASACDQACLEVTSVLTKLSQTLCESGHLPAIVQAAHANLILSTASNHATNANVLGWASAATYESKPTRSAGHLNDVWPYWMDQSEAVSNSFHLNGLFLLTAPNMSGKSTLMRSTAAAALLVNCGLCAPLGHGSTIQRFDNIFVRGASADVPTEGKSAFGAEMGDIAALLRSCGNKSLVFVDELGRGTSPRDGTCLAGAVLEAMAQAGMNGIFATHLHDILDLPLQGRGLIRMKRMTFESSKGDTGPNYVWTYKMDDGFCKNSLALVTAAKFGLPESVLERAKFFGTSLNETDDVSVMVDPTEDEDDTSLSAGETSSNKDSKGEHSLQRATYFAEQISGVEPGRSIRIPPHWTCPPALEGCSCVYILELDNNRFYVGETDSLRKRLLQHRSKGGDWKSCTAVAIGISDGKSQARLVESLLIRKLAQAGFIMESTSDGRVVRSRRRSIALPDQQF